jgi:superfamily II DNA or RNA helicase
VRWVERLQQDFSPFVRNKGRKYFQSGAVRITSGASDKVHAVVAGSRKYAVEIRLNREAIVVDCDCPYFQSEDLCKHIWATLLAAESRGYLTRIASSWNPLVRRSSDEQAEGDAYDFTETQPESPVQFHTRPVTPIKTRRAPSWKEDVAALRRQAGVRIPRQIEAPQRIIYVVDAAECISAGTVVVRCVAAKLKKNGEWGRPNFQESSIRNVGDLDGADQEIIGLLAGSAGIPYGYSSYTLNVSSQHRVQLATVGVLMPLLCATGRFFLRHNSSEDLRGLEWDGGPPWLFRLSVLRDDKTAAYSITGSLRREDEEQPVNAPLLLVPGLAFFDGRVARFDDAGAFEWIAFLRRGGRIEIPLKQRNDLVTELAQFPEPLPMDVPDELQVESREFARPPHLTIRSIKESWRQQDRLQCEVTFDYGVKVAESQPGWAVYDPESDNHFKRHKQAEANAIHRLIGLGVHKAAAWNGHGWELATSRLPGLVNTLLAEGWRVEAQGHLYRRPNKFNIAVSSGIDWLELQGGAEFEGEVVALPEILKALGRNEKFVQLGDGSFGQIPEEWLERYGFIARLGHATDDQFRFTRTQAGLLDALLASQPEVTFDEGFLRLRRELESFAGIAAIDAPSTFTGCLRDYQREGLGWFRFLRRFGFGGCLADDMGLGKTVQVLALLDSDDRRGPALVVVPRSLVFNWKEEAARFTPRLQVLDFTGVGRKDRWKHIHQHDIVLTTYGTMRRDAPQLRDIHFDSIVLDEAQAIKNPASESAKAARLLKCDHRLALTGTPIENHLGDLWSIFEFLNPGLLGSATVFRSQTSGTLSRETAPILSKALRPFILRRTKEQVVRELPPKTEQTIYCELDHKERKLYNELREHYRASLLGRIEKVGIQKSRMQILEALLRLRQVACHPGLIDPIRAHDSSSKLDALLAQLQEVVQEGHKALVFSQFTSFLAIVRKRLDAEQILYEYLDGSTRDRQTRVQCFQENKDCPLFLVSLKAGGLGLNLTAAEYVFLLDPWWNPAVEVQAIDRTHRIGQSHRVFAYRLIAKDTVEEKVLDLQKSKRDLADAIITAENSAMKQLDRETLELLLS